MGIQFDNKWNLSCTLAFHNSHTKSSKTVTAVCSENVNGWNVVANSMPLFVNVLLWFICCLFLLCMSWLIPSGHVTLKVLLNDNVTLPLPVICGSLPMLFFKGPLFLLYILKAPYFTKGFESGTLQSIQKSIHWLHLKWEWPLKCMTERSNSSLVLVTVHQGIYLSIPHLGEHFHLYIKKKSCSVWLITINPGGRIGPFLRCYSVWTSSTIVVGLCILEIWKGLGWYVSFCLSHLQIASTLGGSEMLSYAMLVLRQIFIFI